MFTEDYESAVNAITNCFEHEKSEFIITRFLRIYTNFYKQLLFLSDIMFLILIKFISVNNI